MRRRLQNSPCVVPSVFEAMEARRLFSVVASLGGHTLYVHGDDPSNGISVEADNRDVVVKRYGQGGYGNDKLYGNAGNDGITGGAGVDWLAGGADNDELHANDGHSNDLVFGGDDNGADGGFDTAYVDKPDGVWHDFAFAVNSLIKV